LSLLVRFQQVSKDYIAERERVHALSEISLEVRTGEFVAFMGRSGCGKSTLLNLAGAMDFPSSGTVWLDGKSTTGLSDAALTRVRRETVGFVFQSFQLLQNMTVAENVELPLLLAGVRDARKKALETLAWVELEGYGDRLPHQLSGGQMQRAGIARALVHGPKLLLADEPIGNLDSNTGDVVLSLLRRSADERKTTILMATHSLESTQFCDRVIRLRDGRIVT
jgi:ABC-type lipoprotein export system ATPase subunit